MSNIEKASKASLEGSENRQLHIKFQKELDEILAKYF
jgi:hypothetical protein